MKKTIKRFQALIILQKQSIHDNIVSQVK